MRPVTRFAPSPTGYLHLGHVHAALAVDAYAQALGADVLLRIEDIDPNRCKPEFTQGILEDLAWLGLKYTGEVIYQTDRFESYAAAIEQLKAMKLIYPCACSRKSVVARSPGSGPDGPIYDHKCKLTPPPPDAPGCWRLDMDAAILAVEGMGIGLTHNPRPWGDLILVRRETPTSYHISVVVDDAADGITHIMRGEDLRGITAVHELLQHVLGLPVPTYAFHALLMQEDGSKYSKQTGAPAIADMRKAGKTPADLQLALNRVPNLRGQIDAIKSGDFL